MDTTEDWTGNCQVSLDDEMQKNEDQQVDPIVPGFANFDDYVQVRFNLPKSGISWEELVFQPNYKNTY